MKSTTKTAQLLKTAGVTACGLANNHIFDFGVAGLRDTFDVLNEAGIEYFGAGFNVNQACKPYIYGR